MTRKFVTMSLEIAVFTNADQGPPITEADYDMFIGTSGSDDPLVAFCDKEQLISSERYSYYGSWRGWKHEIIEDEKEYFIRKLKGK